MSSGAQFAYGTQHWFHWKNRLQRSFRLPETSRMPQSRFLPLALCLLTLTACGHMPWSKKPAPPPQPVQELTITGADGAPATAFPQYWKRNTLVVDLQSASGNGSVTLKPGPAKWPVRIALR